MDEDEYYCDYCGRDYRTDGYCNSCIAHSEDRQLEAMEKLLDENDD